MPRLSLNSTTLEYRRSWIAVAEESDAASSLIYQLFSIAHMAVCRMVDTYADNSKGRLPTLVLLLIEPCFAYTIGLQLPPIDGTTMEGKLSGSEVLDCDGHLSALKGSCCHKRSICRLSLHFLWSLGERVIKILTFDLSCRLTDDHSPFFWWQDAIWEFPQ